MTNLDLLPPASVLPPPEPISDDQRERFLDNLREGWTISKAGTEAGLSIRSIRHWRKLDAELESLIQDALQEGADRLEDEAFRRAVVGVDTPVVYQGEVIEDQTTKSFSDSLLTTLLKGKFPHKYARTELTGKDGSPLIPETSNRRLAMAVMFIFKDQVNLPIEKILELTPNGQSDRSSDPSSQEA